jgi:pilus assembly protein TadC
MSEGIGLAPGRDLRTLIRLPLLLYVLLQGLDATVLQRLQHNGAAHAVNGENPISFCNVFFLSQAIVGLSALLFALVLPMGFWISLSLILADLLLVLIGIFRCGTSGNDEGQSDRPPGR